MGNVKYFDDLNCGSQARQDEFMTVINFL